jgi:hypothetical protein
MKLNIDLTETSRGNAITLLTRCSLTKSSSAPKLAIAIGTSQDRTSTTCTNYLDLSTTRSTESWTRWPNALGRWVAMLSEP